MHILLKVMLIPWISADNSDSDYINLWITRKQSLGYIRIALSVPLSRARLLESCLANNFLIMGKKLTYIGT